MFLEEAGDGAPQVAIWEGRAYIVFAFHGRSGLSYAARVGEDDPIVARGFDDEGEAAENPQRQRFSEWVFAAVDRYESQLAYWQGVSEKCQADPAVAGRLGGVEWIRAMPGMAQRLDGG